MSAGDPTLIDPLRRHAGAQPDRPVFIFEDRTTSFAEFDRRTDRVARALHAAGLAPGERVAYLGRNTDIFFELLYGAMKAGIVAAPINWRLAAPEIAGIVADCRARLLVLGREHVADPACRSLPGVTILAAEAPQSDLTDFASWRDAQPDTPPDFVPAPDDIAVQLYTSGTTGLPKGVMLSHRGIAASHHASDLHDLGWNRCAPTDILLLAMPVAHIAGTGWGTIGVHHGVPCHIHRQFDPAATLQAIARHRITKMFLVPAALQAMVRQPEAAATDFSCLSEMGYGASPMPAPLLRECMDVMGTKFVQFYGMTETAGTIVALHPDDHTPDRLRAAGRPLPWVELRVVGPDGADRPHGEVGEVITRSPANMTGYWNRPEETARTIDADGWLRTGDAGYLDADGFLFIHDRIKDMVISGGENVYPAEVESALSAHPAVADVAVIGVPHPHWGEAVHAIIVRRPGTTLDEDELITWARARIAGFKAPRGVTFAETLPRNASGKLLKRALREPFWVGFSRQVN